MEPIELRFTVACSPEHAFEVWATRTSLWWPHSHSRSGDPGLTVTIEPRSGGRVYEFAASGDATTVTIVHRGWERLGARGHDLRRRNRQNWDGLLPHYLRACRLPTP